MYMLSKKRLKFTSPSDEEPDCYAKTVLNKSRRQLVTKECFKVNESGHYREYGSPKTNCKTKGLSFHAALTMSRAELGLIADSGDISESLEFFSFFFSTSFCIMRALIP